MQYNILLRKTECLSKDSLLNTNDKHITDSDL